MRSARVLGSEQAVAFDWRDRVLTLAYPEPARDQPHAVIAVRIISR